MPTPTPEVDLDLIFCSASKKNRIDKLWLKAIATVESSMNPRAYRFEQGFWDRYLKDNPEWKDRDPAEVSASYGLMQLMFTTAYGLGFRGSGEDLYNPVYNIELGAKLLRQLIDKITETTNRNLLPIEIATARYNGGSKGNPGPDGSLRNQEYLTKIKHAYWKLLKEDKNCD